MPRLTVVFMGTAELACASLDALVHDGGFEVLAVVTQPDRPKGRDLKLQPSAVKRCALPHQLPVLQPERGRAPEFVEHIRSLQPDLIVVAAYGQILPSALLEAPRYGGINVHASLLPRHRGAAPIQWALLDGDEETGVTIMKMDAGLDTGAILTQETTPIHPQDDAQTLHDRLAQMGARLLVRTLPGYVAGQIVPRPQPAEGVSYARKITKEDGRLDWSQAARSLHNRLRAFTPWPGTFTFWPSGEQRRLLKVWRADVIETTAGEPGAVVSADKHGVLVACGQGGLLVREVQLEGTRRMSAEQFIAGHRMEPGDRLGH